MDLGSKEVLWAGEASVNQNTGSNKSWFFKRFLYFSFASEHTIAAVLLQKNPQGQEQPIAFFSKALRDAPLKYNIMEK